MGGTFDAGAVISLGSINVDRMYSASSAELAALEGRYDWFPARGQTVEVADVPDDFSPGFDAIRHGGKGANQAVAAARAGAETTMLGKMGSDHEHLGVVGEFEQCDVDVTRIGTAPKPTGTAYVFVEPNGDNRIVVRPGANEAVDRAYVQGQYDAILEADCLLLQNEIPIESVATVLSDLAAEPNRPTVVLDPGPVDGVEELLEYDAVDYLTPNENELGALRPALESFDGVVVRKRCGKDVVVDADRRFTVTPLTVDVVDTTGAGDVLNGFLAACLASGDLLQEAIEIATIAASFSTRERGARSGVPTQEDVRAFRTARDDG